MQIPSIMRVQSRIRDIIQKNEQLTHTMRNHRRQGPQPDFTQDTGKLYFRPETANAPASVFRANHSSQNTSAGPLSFAKSLKQWIAKEAKAQGVHPKLIQAVVDVESKGKPFARSPKGALGLMQLMPQTARALGVDPINPQENLRGGIRYLKTMAQRFGSLDLALAAYNAGPQAVEKFQGIPPYKETRSYIKKVRAQL